VNATDTAAPIRVAGSHRLSQLDMLESEAIHIIREVVSEFERPVLLFSGGKDSIVLLRLAEKAFRPGPFPFPLMHIDTSHNFPEAIEFRDRRVAELGERLIVGEPLGGSSKRVTAVCDVLASAGFKAEASADVRREVWYKLWGNMTMNPVSALTGSTADVILADPLLFDYMLRCMAEAATIGGRIGCAIEQSGEERMGLARELGAFRTSMLQDTEAGRAIELDALVSSVHEIGQRLGIATPNIGALLGLTRLMGRQRGLYPR